MPGYMLLLRESPADFAGMGPEEMQGIIQKYTAWRDSLDAGGKLIGSDKLCDGSGRVMQTVDGDVRITDGPYSETKEVIGGYFAIRADNYEQAVELCRECPHLGYGGSIELREIEEH